MANFFKFIFNTALALASLFGLALLTGTLIVVNSPGSFEEMSPIGDYKVEVVPAYSIFLGREQAYVRVIDIANAEAVYRTPIVSEGAIDPRNVSFDGDELMIWPFFFNRRTKHFKLEGASALNKGWVSSLISNTPIEINQ